MALASQGWDGSSESAHIGGVLDFIAVRQPVSGCGPPRKGAETWER